MVTRAYITKLGLGNESLGLTYTSILSDIAPVGSGSIDSKGSGESNSVDFGMIFKYKMHEYLAYQSVELEASYGMSETNIFDNEISYGNDDQKDPLPKVLRNGLGLYFALPNAGYGNISDYADFFPHIFSAMGTIGLEHDLIGDSVTNAYGMEIGFADFLYYRIGHYSDKDGHVTGSSKGCGIRLNVKNLIIAEANWAKFPGGELTKYQEMYDFMVNLDILEIARMWGR
ncbi:MAG: hypothetical protein JXR56_08865 [Candidatus Cloacimonetes bacterium]|nr:hypothetical protein [Candidatus Cloacimonadota bacterium]